MGHELLVHILKLIVLILRRALVHRWDSLHHRLLILHIHHLSNVVSDLLRVGCLLPWAWQVAHLLLLLDYLFGRFSIK